jgi:nucleoside-diphosphate-sugar epimerase
VEEYINDRRILITGISGTIGKIILPELSKEFKTFGVDKKVTSITPNIFHTDISQHDQIQKILNSIQPIFCIVHLAADPSCHAGLRSVWKNNILTTWNIYSAAQKTGVQRVIFASSNQSTKGYEPIICKLHRCGYRFLLTPQYPVFPVNYYGAGKVLGEIIASYFFKIYGMESICLRIGTVLKDDNPNKKKRMIYTWLSHLDLVQLVRNSIVSDVKFGIYYGISKNSTRIWDISNAEMDLSYQPINDASRYQAIVSGR